jgi:hypothetical protein
VVQIRSRRSALLTPLAIGVVGFLATASADAGGSGSQPGSTSPHVGEPLSSSTSEQRALSAHLKSRGAIFYGAWWCPACFKQKNLFGKEAGDTLPYVECDKTDSRLEGVQTLEELEVWSDYPGSGPAQKP